MNLSTLLNTHVNLHEFRIPLAVMAVLLIVIMGCQIRVLAALIQALPKKAAFKQKSLLTENEREFFGRLKRALPDFEIWPQVAMGAILDPAVPEKSPEYWTIRQEFQSKICDYVIGRKGAPKGNQIVAVIELDDRTHDKAKDARRDAMLRSAGIKTVRFESKAKPNEAQIRQQILALA